MAHNQLTTNRAKNIGGFFFMDQIELFRQIIASCDENLKDTFLRRMEASARIAQSKLDRGVPVYSAQEERLLLDTISSGLAPEMQLKARMLWKSLLRMDRNRQYRVFLELDQSLRLHHEGDLVEQEQLAGQGCCPAGVEQTVRQLLGQVPVDTVDSIEQALEQVEQGHCAWCAVPLRGVYKTDELYQQLESRRLYLNQMLRTEQGDLLAVISPKLVHRPGQEQQISAAFYMPSESGSLAGVLSVLADNKQNMEFIHLEKSDLADELHQFHLYVDFDGCLDSLDTRAAIYQLETELPYFRILGARKRLKG